MRKEIKHGTSIKDFLFEHNKDNEILKSIKHKFPLSTLSKDNKDLFSFASKEANHQYTHLDFSLYSDLWVFPTHQYIMDVNGVEHTISIKTKPSKLLLVRREYTREGATICFSNTKNNFRKNNFNVDQLFRDCRGQIIKFITKYPNDKIDFSKVELDVQKILSIM